MNSAQRRQARREFPHIVEMRPRREGERYFEHDNRVDNGRAWCRKQFKKGAWRYTEHWDYSVFYFANEKDATFFALKWA